MKLIYRTAYMNKLASAMGTPDIKVITGIRRCGKSKLLEAFADQIRASFPTANIIRINFNLLEFEPLMQYRALHDYVEKHFVEGCNNLTFAAKEGRSPTLSWENGPLSCDFFRRGTP